MPLDETLLTPRETAEMLGVGTNTLARWARTGVLEPAVRTPGGHRRYRHTDVETLRDHDKK